jgi:hypothetical protein
MSNNITISVECSEGYISDGYGGEDYYEGDTVEVSKDVNRSYIEIEGKKLTLDNLRNLIKALKFIEETFDD